ncbi:MAG: hypothetical protein Q9170_002897 [Blastenia crenularia]
MAYAQALSSITDITVLLDPNKSSSISLFAMLCALSVGFAFLTAPTMAASLLTSEITQITKHAMQSFAISLQQAPGVARSLWPSGDDLSRTIQIGHLQDQVNNITVELSNSLSKGLNLLMTDVPTFVAFADHGSYSNNDPPMDPNEIKNDLALSLQTYIVSESLLQNNWYARPLGYSTEEEWGRIINTTPSVDPSASVHGGWQPTNQVVRRYRSEASGRVYQLIHKNDLGTVLPQIKDSGWANLPLLFDGAYNCTKYGQVANPQIVHVNFDGTLDVGCISRLPIQIPCGDQCPEALIDGNCPFPRDADCTYHNGGADSVH